MKTALGVLLPVYNAQHTLAEGVADVLEVLPDWAERFELCIIDDGSTDDTAEAARDLAACYPQLRVIRHPVRLGLAEAIQTGLDHTESELILIGNDGYLLDPNDLRMLWKLRDAERQMGRCGSTCSTSVGSGRSEIPTACKTPCAGWQQRRGFQMIRRETFEQFRLDQAIDMIARIDAQRAPGSSETRPNFLGRVKRFAWGE